MAASSTPEGSDHAGAWRFGEFELDGGRRVLTRSGRRVRLSARAFDVLLYLVRHHHRVVARSELLAACWPRRDVTDGVVARVVMSLRKALGDIDPQQGLVQTLPRAGYRFAAPVTASGAAPARCIAPRLAVLPVDDRSGDPSLAWVALGLASLLGAQLGAQLAERGVDELAGVREVVAVLNDAPERSGVRQRVAHVMRALGARAVLETRFVRQHGRCVLHLALHAGETVTHEGSVVADEATDAAGAAATLVARWITAPDAAPQALASGDAFLDEAWQRAWQRLRAHDHAEAGHLFAVLRDAGIETPDLDLAQARLGELRLRADLMAAARRADAIEGDLDQGSHEAVARACREAETAGDRLLLRDACTALGQLAARGGDWAAAERHHAMGLAIAQALHESARAVSLAGLSQACLQQGRLLEARSLGEEARRCARLA